MTRGHNIIADGWAGASNPNPYPKSPTHMQKKVSKQSFPHFSTCVHGRTNRRTNQRMDKASYRVACPQLKTVNFDEKFLEMVFLSTKHKGKCNQVKTFIYLTGLLYKLASLWDILSVSLFSCYFNQVSRHLYI